MAFYCKFYDNKLVKSFLCLELMWLSNQPRFHPDLKRGLYRERGGVVLSDLISLSLPYNYFDVNLDNHVDRGKFFGCQKIFPDQHDCLDYRDHRIRLYAIVTKRNKTHLIMFPNRADRGRCWTRKTVGSVEMCCDLLRSVTREHLRVDTIRCE